MRAGWNPFDKGAGGGGGGKEDAARRAIEKSFGAKKFGSDASKPAANKPAAKPPAGPAKPVEKSGSPLQDLLKNVGGGGGGGPGAPGGGGGGGGGGFAFGQPAPGGEGGEQPLLEEFLALMKGMWVVITNAALFLLFADLLHRSLNWFVQTELLVVVGAPQQALERTVGKFFEVIEWVERHVLGWTLPGDAEAELSTSRVYEVLQNYTPPEAAYTFYQLKHKKMTHEEAQTLHRAYALRYFERADGRRDDVDWDEVERIKAKYEPIEADRRAYKRAKAAGKLDEYWATTGFERPAGGAGAAA